MYEQQYPAQPQWPAAPGPAAQQWPGAPGQVPQWPAGPGVPQQPGTPGWGAGGATPGWAPPAGGGGAIAVTTKYMPLAFMLGLFKPVVTLNGQQFRAGWGRTVLPVPAGQHQLQVHVPYLLPPRIGVASLSVPVYPGQTVELEYRAPLVVFVGGSLGPAPQKYRGAAFMITMLVVVLLLSLCAVGAVIWGASNSDDPVSLPTGPVRRTSDPVAAGTASPDGSTGAATEPAPAGTATPTWQDKPTHRLIGPQFEAGDATYTMAFPGWPFAFRTPSTWGCLAGEVDLPDARAWVCIDEENPDSGYRLNIMLRPCSNSCDSSARDKLNSDWFDGGKASSTDKGMTYWVQTDLDDKGRYTLDVSHFFGDEPGGDPNWQVGAFAAAPPAGSTYAMKVINDILTQTS